ncbi:MAG: TonB-dependent receptor plug domain-containing protein, partial [Pseudomonadota bacterium]|nr:TonB-dependent receptor plug domain-containing protein [Pseudomonadota bacterium]
MPTRISTKSSSQNVAQSPTHQLARSPFALAIIASAVTYAFSSAAEANDAMDHYEVIEVQGATPLSANSNNSAVFGNVQTLTQDDIEGSVNRSLPELLKTQLASVNLNDVQNNPFQPDLQYRGFTASPLLGLPQGISVYLNGGRVNEAFGDTVHWDLMPLDAIDTVSLYSGSNPLFGQNTLGGALALRTKTGFSFNANEIDLEAGQFGQKAASVESGGHNDHWAYYVNLNHYEEDGWRDYSPSEVQQVFTSLAYKSDKMHLDMNLFMADNELLGNGASPIELLDIEGREAVYTHPDQTNNELTHVNITGDFVLTDTLSLTANMFYRDTQTQSINGDDSDFGACQFADGRVTLCEFEDDDDDDDDDAPLDSDDDGDDDDDDDLPVVGEGDDIEAVEFIGFDDDTALAEISDVDADELDGTYNTGRTDAKATGLSFQLAKQYALSGFSSELIVGASYTKGDVNYAADTTFGILENESAQDSRTVLPIDGLMAQEARVRLDVDTTAWSLFFMNSTQLSSAVS